MSYYIGLDLGTGATKGVLWNTQEVVASSTETVEFIREGDAVEIDPILYRDRILQQIRKLAAAADDQIRGIAMCAASGNTLILDQDHRPVSRMISWLDNRQEPTGPDDQVHEIIGWPWCKGFTLAHLMRMRRENPEFFVPGFRVCMNNDYIQQQLCGVFALDYSSATPAYLQDQRNLCYHKAYLDKVGLTGRELSELVPCGTVLGSLRPEIQGGNLTENTQVVTGSFDHPSAARACGIEKENEMLLSCGTSWVGFRPVKERKIRTGYLADPYRLHVDGMWGEIRSWGKLGLELEKWIVEHFSDGPDRYQKLSEDALNGGPAQTMMQKTAEKFRKMAFPEIQFSRIVLCGGPSESLAWRRYIAEVWDCKIEVSPYQQYTGAVGAAMLAAEKLGVR